MTGQLHSCWAAPLSLPLITVTASALLVATASAEPAFEPPVEHAVLMMGETVPDRGRFVAVHADETRVAIPASSVSVYRDQEGLLYLFDVDRPLDRVCIADACGVFAPVPERNGQFALFPANYQRSEH